MLFSEGNREWREIPRWADFLIRLGFQWNQLDSARRIGVVTLPCDSPAAALVSLGALIKDLCDPTANDVDNHFADLMRFAHQYVGSCSTCTIRCDPAAKGCGFSDRASGVLRHRDGNRYQVSGTENSERFGQIISCGNKEEQRQVIAAYSIHWAIDGQPFVAGDSTTIPLDPEPYGRIIPGFQPVPSNLVRSYSGLCLAGHGKGETSTRERASGVRFQSSARDYCLSDLLTVADWRPKASISRVSFYNPRTGRIDHHGCAPSLVVADGDTSFLDVSTVPAFQRADVIGVVERTLDRERLEAVGNRLTELRQWYRDDEESLAHLGDIPTGIGLTILKQRAS
jgi:hypothetical protein